MQERVLHFPAGYGTEAGELTVFSAPADHTAPATYREVDIRPVLLEVPDAARNQALRDIDKLALLANGRGVR